MIVYRTRTLEKEELPNSLKESGYKAAWVAVNWFKTTKEIGAGGSRINVLDDWFYEIDVGGEFVEGTDALDVLPTSLVMKKGTSLDEAITAADEMLTDAANWNSPAYN